MSTKLKLVNKLVEILPQDDTTTYPRLNFNLSNGTYAVPVSATDPNDGNTAASFRFGNCRFYIPTYVFKTITLAGTTNQTITLIYTEPGKLPTTVTSTSIDQEFKVQYGTTWTATATGAGGYNPGTLSTSSGTVTSNTTINASEAIFSGVLTDSNYKMSQIYPSTYQTMTTVPDKLDTSNVTNMSKMFYCCYNLTTVPQLDTSEATNMNNMFYGCQSLKSILEMDTNKVTDMNNMFYRCSSLKSIPQLDTNKVTNMRCMFEYCEHLTSIPELDTSNVTDMLQMFKNCESLTNIPQLNTSKVTNMYCMFEYCSVLTNIPQLDTSNVTRMSYMFTGCESLPAIFPWTIDCSSISDANNNMNCMFRYSSVTKVTLKNVNSSIRSQITSQLLKGDNTLTINFV